MRVPQPVGETAAAPPRAAEFLAGACFVSKGGEAAEAVVPAPSKQAAA